MERETGCAISLTIIATLILHMQRSAAATEEKNILERINMKLHEIIDKIDVKNLEAKSLEWDFFEEFEIYDISRSVCNEGFRPRLKEHYIEVWYCSDSYAGTRAIFFDDELLCIGQKSGRKSSEEFSYASQEKFLEFYKYLKSFEASRVPKGSEIDINVDIGDGYKISFSSGIMDHKNVIYKGELCEIINKKPIDGYVCQSIEIMHDNKSKVVDLTDVIFPFNIGEQCQTVKK